MECFALCVLRLSRLGVEKVKNAISRRDKIDFGEATDTISDRVWLENSRVVWSSNGSIELSRPSSASSSALHTYIIDEEWQ